MPGAKTDLHIDYPDDRGLRSPRHVGYLDRQQRQYLQPFMAAPLRPGETLVGCSIRGRSDMNTWLQLPNSPLMYSELALFIVPLAGLGQDFIEMLISTGEDVAERSTANLPGAGGTVNTWNRGDQGHISPGYEQAARPWAGEIGGETAGADVSSSYMPYVSASTWKIAQEWYDIEYANKAGGLNDDDLFDNPPVVENYIRSVHRSGFDLGLLNVDPEIDPTPEVNHYAELVNHLYLLTQPELTYAEYLAAHGVDPRRSSGISALYMLDHGLLVPTETALYGGVAGSVANRDGITLADSAHGVGFTAGGGSAAMWHDRKPLASFGRTWDTYRRKPIRIEAPSVLIGTHVHWVVDQNNQQFAHLGISNMTHPGHWGNRAFGGIEEEDFMSVRALYQTDGNTLISGDEDDQTTGIHAQNLLNLYIHGDEFSGSNGYDVPEDAFNLRQPLGTEVTNDGDQLVGLNSRFSVQLHVLSDLVGNG